MLSKMVPKNAKKVIQGINKTTLRAKCIEYQNDLQFILPVHLRPYTDLHLACTFATLHRSSFGHGYDL
jgi:hypothetical protein